MVTALDIQQMIIDEVGDTPNGILAQRIGVIWDSYADKAYIYPRLQELYAHRRAIDLVLATLRNDVTFQLDGAIMLRLGDRTKYLVDRKAEVQADIHKFERIAQAGRPGVQGQLVHVNMETPPIVMPPPTIVPDANAEWYKGSPYWTTGYVTEPPY